MPAFAVGITESNPHLLAPGPQPARFRRFRDALAALAPSYVRVLVDWSAIQPSASAPPDWRVAGDGCDRGRPPCAPTHGILDTLRAVQARGARPVILFYGTPDWAGEQPSGCDRAAIAPRARMPRPAPYRALVRSLVALGRAQHLDLAYWSAWNEPNLPVFLAPQRAACDGSSPSLAVGEYTRLARVLQREVGLDHMVVGEASGIGPHSSATGAAELARGLPDDLVCGAAAWAQHAYVTVPRDQGRRQEAVPRSLTAGIVGDVERALDGHRCGHRVPVWITETGAGSRPGACAAMAAQLRAWRADPQVTAAFQYTLREDPFFPTGLADPGLTRLYPAYEAWRTRGAGPCPDG